MAAAPAKIVLTADRDCPTCFRKLEELDNAKILSCGHVVCLPCLENNLKGNQCPDCRAEYEMEALDSLPIYETPQPELVYEPSDVYICEIKGCDNNCYRDGCFCRECQMILCNYHKQVDLARTETLEDSIPHRYVTLGKYVLNRQKYSTLMCEEHKLFMTVACRKCFQALCNECQTMKDRKCRRKIESLEETVRKLVTVLEKHLEDSMEDLDRMFFESGKNMESIIAEAEKNKEQMREMKEKQLAAITAKYEQMERDINNHVKICEAKVAAYRDAVDEETRRIRKLRESINLFIESSADHELVRSFRSKIIEVKQDLQLRCASLQLEAYMKYTAEPGSHSKPEVQLTIINSENPQLMSETSIEAAFNNWSHSDYCYSVDFTPGMRLLASTVNGLEIRDSDTLKLTSPVIDTGMTYDVKTSVDAVYAIAHAYQPTAVVIKLDIVTGEITERLKYRTGPYIPHMALSERQFFVLEYDSQNTKSIKAVELHGEIVKSYKLPSKNKHPRGLLSLNDDSLLITDFASGSITKFRLGDDEILDVEWELQGFDRPVGMSKCHNGDFVCVCSWSGHKFYMITVEGQLLRELTCPALQRIDYIRNISIYEDRVAIACREAGIKLFRLKWTGLDAV